MGPTPTTPWHHNELRALSDVKNTFSSWDKCMQKAYCKWPAIVGIIIGSLVVLGILWCLVGCICCGYTCCKGCCSCCSCCARGGGGGGEGGGGGRSKYADPPPTFQQPPPQPPPNFGFQQGYQQPAPPVYSSPMPQYAQFDTPSQKPVHEDSLPPMPSWSNATTRRVEDTSQDVEMSPLAPPPTQSLAAIGRSRSGYQEVPNQPLSPRFDPDNPYRTADYVADPSTPSNIGVAHSNGYDNQPYRTHSPVYASAIYAERPFDRSPTGAQMPPLQNANPPYPQDDSHGQQQTGYVAYTPSIPASPPPPFSSTHGDNSAGRRTPGALQVGRKPVENSWRDV